MGGKMYVHIEVRDSLQDLPVWNMVQGESYEGHSTLIFALLAGVGNNYYGIEPLDVPRGLPEDVSWQIRDIYPGHPRDRVTSWFTLDELEEKVDWDRFISVWHEVDFSEDTMSKLRELAKGHSEVRIVFWFNATMADLKHYEKSDYTFTPRG